MYQRNRRLLWWWQWCIMIRKVSTLFLVNYNHVFRSLSYFLKIRKKVKVAPLFLSNIFYLITHYFSLLSIRTYKTKNINVQQNDFLSSYITRRNGLPYNGQLWCKRYFTINAQCLSTFEYDYLFISSILGNVQLYYRVSCFINRKNFSY